MTILNKALSMVATGMFMGVLLPILATSPQAFTWLTADEDDPS